MRLIKDGVVGFVSMSAALAVFGAISTRAEVLSHEVPPHLISPMIPDSTQTVDGVTWRYRTANGRVELGGDVWHGESPIAADSEDGIAVVPDKLVLPSRLGGNPVRGIRSGSFENFTNLTSVTIPEGLTYIESGAFYRCTALSEISFPDSLMQVGTLAFCETPWLESQPEGFVRAGKVVLGLKGECPETIMLPTDVKGIAGSAFMGIDFDDDGAFARCGDLKAIEMPDSVEIIGNYAFSYCTGLVSVTLPTSLSFLGERAFEHCSSLTSVTIPGGVSWMGYSVFERCSALTNVVIAEGVEWISEAAFSYCPSLKEIELPASVKCIEGGAFSETGLTNVVFRGGPPEAAESAFGYDMTNVVGVYQTQRTAWESVISNGTWRGLKMVYRPNSSVEDGDPLSLLTSDLPPAMEKVAYEAQLVATNGTLPYAWSLRWHDYSRYFDDGSFKEVGTAQGWRADDACWELDLPFDFPFYDSTYRKVYVSSNGTLAFDGYLDEYSASVETFTNRAMVAVLWNDLQTTEGDIYVAESADSVTIRWKGVYFGGTPHMVDTNSVVSVSATLFRDGTIRLSYFDGTTSEGRVGVSSGDGERFNGCGEIFFVGAGETDIVFRRVRGLPEGLALSDDGRISGVPITAGTNTFTVIVTDATGETAKAEQTIVVKPNPNQRPVIEEVFPTTNVVFKAGEWAAFSATAYDPEGVDLVYTWTLDGSVMGVTTNEEHFAFRTHQAQGGAAHTLTCFVSDGFWTNEVRHAWSFRVVRDWYVDASVAEDGDGLSSDSALASLDDAIALSADGDTIYVAPGTYEMQYWFDECPISVVATEGPSQTFLQREFYGGAEKAWLFKGFTLKGFDAYGISLQDCILTGDEDGKSSRANRCRLENCLVTGNRSGWDILESCEVVRCTLAGNVVRQYGVICSGYEEEPGIVRESIVWGNVTAGGDLSNYDRETWAEEGDGTNETVRAYVRFENSCTWPMPLEVANAGNITNDPWLVDVANGDLRLRVGSPCLDANGVQTMGARLGDPVEGYVLSVRIDGNGGVSPLTAVVPAGGSATFVVTNAVRPFLGFSTNGVFATADETLTWPNVMADGIVTAAFSNFTFHVDAATGNDANDGRSWASPKASIQSAIDETRRGETILVKPGTYAPIVTEGRPALRIVGIEGKAVTLIDGGGTNACARLEGSESLLDDSTLVGFTITNGYSSAAMSSCGVGGGVSDGRIEDCDVIDCSAMGFGGGIVETTAIRCRILGNSVAGSLGAGGVYSSMLINCLVADNESRGSHSFVGGASWSTLHNCTVVGNSVVGFGTGGVSGCNLYNTIVYDNSSVTGASVRVASDINSLEDQANCWIGTDPGFVDVANGDYRLASGSPCIDAGANAFVQGDRDLAGNPRLVNGTVDIGCYEDQKVAGLSVSCFVGDGSYSCRSVEGSAIDFTVALSGSAFAPQTLYAYLLCDGADAAEVGNCFASPCLVTNASVAQAAVRGLLLSRGSESVRGCLVSLDNTSPFGCDFSVVLCTSSTYDPASRVDDYKSGTPLHVQVVNANPSIEFLEVKGRTVAYPGETCAEKFYVGEPIDVRVTVDDVERDLPSLSVTWHYEETSVTTCALTNALVFSTSGTHQLTLAVADKDGGVSVAQFPLVVESPKPDLSVSFDGLADSSLMPGDTVTVRYVESNCGVADARAPWTDKLMLRDASDAAASVHLRSWEEDDGLAVGIARTNSVTCVIPELVPLAGAVRFVLEADADGVLDETNESNNRCTSASFLLGKRLYLSAAASEVKENVASGVRFTVRRSGPVDAAQSVTVGAADATSLSVPTTVTIPAGSVSTIFTVMPVDNSVVDGTRLVPVSVSADGFRGAFVPLTILDDEVPRLSVSLSQTSIREGDGVIIVTVTREGSLDEPLTVYLNGGSSRVSLPASVVIPAGEASVTFEIAVPDNDTAQVAANLTLRASAAGYASASADYTVEDDDVPGVTLTLSPETVSEGAGARAVYATLTRSDTNHIAQAVRVRLTASEANQLILPGEVTIPKYTMSVRFAIGVIDNARNDGDREVTVNGAGVIESCGCDGQPSNGDVIQATLGIIDNDGPALALVADPATMREGLSPAGYLTLSHNSTLAEDLTVRLWVDEANADEISLPETVTIPAGETSVRIPVTTLDDGVEDGGQLVSVYAEDAEGVFAAASTWIQVSDQNLPDLQVASVETVQTVISKESLSISFVVTNVGFMARSGTIPYAVHLVKGANGGTVSSATLVKSGTLTGDLAVNGALSGAVQVTAPELPGDYRVAVVLDPDGTISELDAANNTGWSAAFAVGAAYTATAGVDGDKVCLPGATVMITGLVTRADGTLAANVPVDVYVMVNGFRRTLSAKSAADGLYAVAFAPTAGEAGDYTVGATYPGVVSSVAQDGFSILGMKRASTENVIWDFALGDTETRTIQLVNRSAVPLTGMTVSLRDVPVVCKLDFDVPETLPANGRVALSLTATAVGVTEQVDYEKFAVRIETAEGVSLEIPLYFHAQTQQACLRATPAKIDTTMAVGATRYLDVTILNDGKGDSGALSASVPDVPWLKIMAGSSVANLASGESAVVTLALTPTEADELTLNSPLAGGQLVINCANGKGCSVPLRFTPVSEATGRVCVDVVDNNTYYLESRPHLSNATVKVSNPYTGAVVATGLTGEDGIWTADGIPEGTYQLTITAANHETYADRLVIEPGKEAKVTAFLQYRLVTATWDVKKTEIEDSYDIDLVLEFETQVPAPIVKTTMPKELPTLAEGESYAFTITLANEGVIAADKVTLTMPEIEGYTFTLSDNEVAVPAKSSVTIAAVFSRPVSAKSQAASLLRAASKTTSVTVTMCRYYTHTKVFYRCGPDGRLYSYRQEVRHGECETERFVIPDDNEDEPGDPPKDKDPKRTPQEGSIGPGGPGGFGGGGGGTYTKRDCDPCLDAIRKAREKLSSEAGDVLWKGGRDFAAGKLIPFMSCVDLLVNMSMSYFDPVKRAVEYVADLPVINVALQGHFQSYLERRTALHGIFSLGIDFASCAADVGAAMITVGTGGFGAGSFVAAAGVKTFLQCLKEAKPAIEGVSDIWQVYQTDEALFVDTLLKELDPDSDVSRAIRLNCNSNGTASEKVVKVIEDIAVVENDLASIMAILRGLAGSLFDSDYEYLEIAQVMHKLFENVSADDFLVKEEDFVRVASGAVSEDDLRRYASEWNAAVESWREGPEAHNSPIDFNSLGVHIVRHSLVQDYVKRRGFANCVEMLYHDVDTLNEALDAAQDAVCASVTLKLSQTMAMTREAFDGTLTLYNGNTTTPISDLKMDVSVLDEDGNECKDLFEIFANGTSGAMSEGSALDGGLSVAANGTGSAMIRFIPARQAAPTEPKLYRFGGTIVYTDPFSGETATVKLVPVALTVSPAPYLHLDYFVQRDVCADNPLTPDVVEASLPAELAVLVRNVGGGAAKGVTIASAVPETVLNEKGLSVAFDLKDYTLEASALNGATAHLGLNTVLLGTVAPNESKVAQWWLTSSIEGHFVGMSATVTPVNSWNTPDTTLVDPSVGVHKLIRSVVADGDSLPDFLVCDSADLYGRPDAIYTATGDILPVAAASVATSATLPAGREVALSVTLTPAQPGWNYGSAVLPGVTNATVTRVVRTDGSEVPLRNVWITDRTFRDGTTPLREDRLHIVDDCTSAAARTYTVTLEAKSTDVPEVASFEGVTDGGVEYAARDAVTVTFTKPIEVATFTTDDLNLTKQGEYVHDLSALTIMAADDTGTRFTIGSLSALCSDYGRYELTVQCAGIADAHGNLGRVGKSVAWTFAPEGSEAPQLSALARVASDGFGGETFLASFDRAVVSTCVTLANWTLRRNGSSVSWPTSAQVVARNAAEYALSGIDGALDEEGVYELTFSATGVSDAAGHTVTGEKTISWTVDRTPPACVSDLAISPDGGFSDSDGITWTRELTVSGTLPEDGLTVEILCRYVGGGETLLATLAADATSASLPFSQAIVLPGVGNVTLVVRLTDAAGNSSDTEKSVFVDALALTGTLSGAPTDTAVVASTASLAFSDRVMDGGVTLERFTLARDGEAIALEGVSLSKVDDVTFTLTGLDALCAEDGAYVLRFDGSAVRKYLSGLTMGGTLALRWRHEKPDRVPPTVTAVLFDGEEPHAAYTNVFSTIAVTFSEAVNVPTLIENGLIGRAARIDLLDAANVVTGSAAVVQAAMWDARGNTLTWAIDPATVPVGRARLTLEAGLISDLAGNRLSADGFPSVDGLRAYVPTEQKLAQVNAQAMPCWQDGTLYVGEKTPDGVGKIRRYAADGTWSYLQSSGADIEIPSEGCQGASVAFADTDGDGEAEIYVGTADGRVLKYPGGEEIGLSLANGRAMPFAVDLNGDGLDELIVGGLDGHIHVLSRRVEGGVLVSEAQDLLDSAGSSLKVPNGRAAPVVADINHDGFPDILSGDTAGNIWAFLGKGSTWCAQPVAVFANTGDVADRSRLGVGDVDGDGVTDLVVGRSDGSVTLLRGVERPVPSVTFEVCAFTLAMSVNAEDLEWTTGGAAEWQPVWDGNAYDGQHCAQSGVIGNDTNAWIETTVEGAGVLSFAWRCSTEARYDMCQLLVDGEVKGVISGETPWTTNVVSLVGGTHTVRWNYRKSRSGAAGEDRAWLDAVSWTPEVPLTLAEALNPELFWETKGDVAWKAVRKQSVLEPRDGWAVAEELSDYGYSSLETLVYGAGTLTFDWAVSCEDGYDWFDFLVDGEVRASITGETVWKTVTVEFADAGRHALKWEYWKDDMDEAGHTGENRAKLDNVIWTPLSADSQWTTTTPDPIPFDVIRTDYPDFWKAAKGDYEAAAHLFGRNGYAIWQSYVAGLNPDEEGSRFKAKIEMADGQPVVTWEPDTPELRATRTYTTYGKKTLLDRDWTPVTDANRGDYNFFKVEVRMKRQ